MAQLQKPLIAFIQKRLTVFFLCFFVFNQNLMANEPTKVQISLPNNITANADYFQGEPGKATLLILHGFLLTHNFHTVKRLAESLHESGYSVLTPTLSLGINKRAKSLECEAIHTHSMEQDLSELNQWVQWLKKKNNDKIILVGHSTGSLHVIWYLSQYINKDIKHAVFLSIPNFGPSSFTYETVEYTEKAQQLVAENDFSLHDFGLSYCKKYTTTAQNYLSYYKLSKENTFKRLENMTTNKTLIFGTKDKRIDTQWNEELGQLNMDVITIESANHFFDYEHEFDLLDNIEIILNRIH